MLWKGIVREEEMSQSHTTDKEVNSIRIQNVAVDMIITWLFQIAIRVLAEWWRVLNATCVMGLAWCQFHRVKCFLRIYSPHGTNSSSATTCHFQFDRRFQSDNNHFIYTNIKTHLLSARVSARFIGKFVAKSWFIRDARFFCTWPDSNHIGYYSYPELFSTKHLSYSTVILFQFHTRNASLQELHICGE